MVYKSCLGPLSDLWHYVNVGNSCRDECVVVMLVGAVFYTNGRK